MASSGHMPSETRVIQAMLAHGADVHEGWVTPHEIADTVGTPVVNLRRMLAVLERQQRVQSRTYPDGQTRWQLDRGGRS